MESRRTDIFIIGGGINGAAIARDAAGRGASVVLCEQGDLASATSSASTKLIHGGLRYLEYYEFRLVREALFERERYLRAAPHIIWPLAFILPQSAVRPDWLVRLGLFIYDHLAPRGKLPATRSLRLDRSPVGKALRPGYRRAFVYSDCWVQDSRLVILNAMDAARNGADILPRVRCVSARREKGFWRCSLVNAQGITSEIIAKTLVNAAGPWVQSVLGSQLGVNSAKHVRMVKGSHIVLPRLYEGDFAFMLQNDDRRIVFAIPYEKKFTLVGTTDAPFEGDPGMVTIDKAETAYLLSMVNQYFCAAVSAADIVWSYSGVRPLYDDAAANAAAVTRDYALDLNGGAGEAPVLSIFGGKITTSRKLAEHALEKLAPFLPNMRGPWTAEAIFPGGDLGDDFDRFVQSLGARYPFLAEDVVLRLARAYGALTPEILGDAKMAEDLGHDFGFGLSAREIAYLRQSEWAETADDILWRRSKLGLHFSAEQARALADYLAAHPRS